MESEHSPGCNYATDQLCTCHHIAELEEKAEWLGGPAPSSLHSGLSGYGGSGSHIFCGTMTAMPMGTYAAGYSPHWGGSASAYDPGKAKVDDLMARRAEIYAKADAKTKWSVETPWDFVKGKLGF